MIDAPAYTEAATTVTAHQAAVLAAIPEAGGLVPEIAADARFDPKTTRNVLGWLASKGLVCRQDGLWLRSAAPRPFRAPSRARPRPHTAKAPAV